MWLEIQFINNVYEINNTYWNRSIF